ncbi:hypothetical protein QPK87_37480 [Kamptonema cortianum]|nr:hypothetical protein [Geitlerinema splendidum]MDK3162200.1 hypothetical protein [Kamptonema cortianum]
MLNWLPALLFLIAQGSLGPGVECGRSDLARLVAHSSRIQSVCMAAAALAAKADTSPEMGVTSLDDAAFRTDGAKPPAVFSFEFAQESSGMLTAISPRDGPVA